MDEFTGFVSSLFLIVGIIWFLIGVFVLVTSTQAAIQRYFLAPRRNWTKDISHLYIPTLPIAQDTITWLSDLGYQPFGVAEAHSPYPPLKLTYVWLYANPSQQTIVWLGVFMDTVLVGFESFFLDESMVETAYPVGSNVLTPNFQSNEVTVSLEDAHWQQQNAVEAWSQKHGAPVSIQNMGEYLQRDSFSRKHYSKHRVKRTVVRNVVLSISNLFLSISYCVSVVYAIVSRNMANLSYPFSIALIIALLVLYWEYPHLQYSNSQRQKDKTKSE